MGWIRYPTKSTITDGLRAADPAVASAAKALADLMIAHLERLDDAEAVEGMVYSALRRAATQAPAPPGPMGNGSAGSARRPSKFDLYFLARVHAEAITDLAVAMTVFIAREEEGQPIKGADLEERVASAMRRLAGSGN